MKEITVPWPSAELSSNSRAHWARKSRATSIARQYAKAVCLATPRIECSPDATIFVEYYPPNFRRDRHNIPAMLKPYIDGIADAMGCDDSRFNVDFPNQWAGQNIPGKVVFRIEGAT